MRAKRTVLYSILLLLVGLLFIGVGFAVSFGKYDELFNAILHTFGILFWSFLAGNGVLWLLISIFNAYLMLKRGMALFALILQMLVSFALGYSMAVGLFINNT